MTKHSRGNVSILHNGVQDLLIYLLEARGRRVYKEFVVTGIAKKFCVVDVVDYTDPAHPVYYEVESAGRTRTFLAKEKEFVKRLGKDLVLVNLRDLRKRHGMNPGYFDMKRWLEELII